MGNFPIATPIGHAIAAPITREPDMTTDAKLKFAVASFGCTRDSNHDYVRIYVTPKGEDAIGYRVSRGGAEVLAAEIFGAMDTDLARENIALREAMGKVRRYLNNAYGDHAFDDEFAALKLSEETDGGK
jgi:hypothetical protein